MWQVLLAAAVAGSTGLVAKHLFSPLPDPSNRAPEEGADEPSTPGAAVSGVNESECESGKSQDIFRFSSSGSGGARSKGSRKKLGTSCQKSTRKGAEVSGSSGNTGAGPSKSGRKFYISLKRRKTGKNAAPKSGSGSSKESSSFNHGLGVGIMYMMSAGKAEIRKLNSAVDETAKVVKELKTELRRRKSSQHMQDSSSAGEVSGGSRRPATKLSLPPSSKSKMENSELPNTQMSLLPVVDDGEYASSDLTEEPEQEVLEMTQLEAELESELEKLPWSIGTSCETGPYLAETEFPCAMDHEPGPQVPESCQFNGVLPSVLNQKLSHVLIKQQESQITELETELNSTQSKLQEKEAELQALKDCVRRLTEFNLSNGSDDERDAHDGEEWAGNWDYSSNGSESKRPVVGMKRPIDS